MNQWKQLLLYLYLCILEREKLELNFSNFLTIKKLELDFTNLFNHSKNNHHWFFYWTLRKVLAEKERCLWDLNSLIFKNHYKTSQEQKKVERLSFCTSISYKPRLILLASQGFTHTIFLSFSQGLGFQSRPGLDLGLGATRQFLQRKITPHPLPD